MFTNTKLRRMGIQIKVWLWSPWLFSLHSHLNGHKMQHLQGSYRTSNFMRTGDFWDWNSCIPRLKTMGFFQTDSRDKFKTITLLKIAYFTNTHFTFCYHWPLANTPVCMIVWRKLKLGCHKKPAHHQLRSTADKSGELRKGNPSALSTFSTKRFKYNPEGNNNKHSSTTCVSRSLAKPSTRPRLQWRWSTASQMYHKQVGEKSLQLHFNYFNSLLWKIILLLDSAAKVKNAAFLRTTREQLHFILAGRGIWDILGICQMQFLSEFMS